nr:hypothetical protein Iba_chr06bCG12790 [Ipomoea batatas]
MSSNLRTVEMKQLVGTLVSQSLLEDGTGGRGSRQEPSKEEKVSFFN